MLSSDFEYQRVDVEGVTVNCAAAGSGPPMRQLGFAQLLGPGASLDAAVMEDFIRCFSDPRTIAGSCATFSSGYHRAHDPLGHAVP